MSKVEVNTNGSSTYNSDGVYVSDNTFEELEEIFSLKTVEEDQKEPDIIIDAEAPEIIGIFDFPSPSLAVETWYGSKKTQLMDAFDLSKRITNLTSAERKQYDDHFEEVSNNFKSSLTEIDNIKGRYFLMEEPGLLNQDAIDQTAILNPYIGYFEDENDQWEGYNYSRNSYWAFLDAQNNFIDAIGNSRKPPSIDGAHENLANNLEKAALDRKWKRAMINGSEFAQAVLQSVNDLVKSGVNLEGYDLQIYHDDQQTGIFDALEENSSLGIIYASHSPGYSLIKATGTAFDKMKATSFAMGGESFSAEKLETFKEPQPEELYDNFEFINYQVLAQIFSKWTDNCMKNFSEKDNENDGILNRILGNVDSNLSLNTIEGELRTSNMGNANNCFLFYSRWPITNTETDRWTPIPRNLEQYEVSSGFNINHGQQQKCYYHSTGFETSEYLTEPYNSEEAKWSPTENEQLGALLIGGRNTEDYFIDSFNPGTLGESTKGEKLIFTSPGNTGQDLIDETARIRHSIVWQWNSLYSIYNFIINRSIEKVYYSLLSQFGSGIGPLEDFKSSVFSSWKGSPLQTTLVEVLKSLPKSNEHFLEAKADGRWNIISQQIQELSDKAEDHVGLAIYMSTPGLEDIAALATSFKNFRKMLSESTTLYLGDPTEETIDSSIFPSQILNTYRKNNPYFQSPKYSITEFSEKYYDPMRIFEGSYAIPNNDFWEIQISGLSGADLGNQNKIIESWREIDRLEKEAKKSQNKLIEFTSTTLSSELTSLIKQKSIDLGFIFRNYNKWSLQRIELENILTSASFEQPARKWTELQKWLEQNSTYESELEGEPEFSIIVVGLPYSKRWYTSDSYTIYVDGAEISADDKYDQAKAKYLLHIIHGVDTSLENFPSDKSWNTQYYSDPVSKNEVGLFDWSPQDFEDNKQLKQLDSRWNIFPFLFPDMAYSQMTVEKKYEKIVYLKASTQDLEGNIEVEVGESTKG